MQQTFPFQPRGGGYTTSVAVTASSQALNLPITMPVEGATLRLVNDGTETVFVTFDGSAATAANGMPLLAGKAETFTIGPGESIHVIGASTGSTLYATMGDGI